MRKFAASIVLLGAVIFGTAALASAYPITGATLTLSPSTVAPGGSVTATFTGCTTGQVVTVSIAGGDSDTDTCASPAIVTLTAPTTPGTYTVTATGPSASATATLTVVAPAAAGDGALPATGSDSTIPIAQIAAGVTIAGLGLAGVAWYRRRSTAAA